MSFEYPAKTRMDAVKQVLEQGRKASDVARDLNLSESTLYLWISRARKAGHEPSEAEHHQLTVDAWKAYLGRLVRINHGRLCAKHRDALVLLTALWVELDDAGHRLGLATMAETLLTGEVPPRQA